MNISRSLACLVTLLLLFPGAARGQEQPPPEQVKGPRLKVEKARVGFLPYDVGGRPINKPGMWTPVQVEIVAGEKPIPAAQLILETIDNEDVGTQTIVPFSLNGKERRNFTAYVRPGNMSADVKVSVEFDNRTFDFGTASQGAIDLHMQLLLTVGSKMRDLQQALEKMNLQKGGDDDTRTSWPRFAAYETDVDLLPDQWIGYQGVDLLILSTDRKDFLDGLLRQNSRDRLRAMAEWVLRGGRLVVPVYWLNQGEVAQIFKQPAWQQPPLPARLPDDAGDIKQNAPTRVDNLGPKTLVADKGKTIPLAMLQSPGAASDWEVLAETKVGDSSRPLIVRMPYGLGSITFVALSLEQPPVSLWEGRYGLWQRLVLETAPRAVQMQQAQFNQMRFGGGEGQNADLSTDLYRTLDNFDIKVVPFGWVALFILLYILVVGPLDYLLLKYVFHRLEWTWITFPTVVFAVSVAAYFTAYAIKGNDLKINQIDVIDFDLRTEVDDKQRTKRAYAYGRSFFMLLSPRIQNYTIGLEPNPGFWGQTSAKPLSADMMSWFGPAQSEAFNGIGRRGTQSYFRRPYMYANDAVGLERVPIPVWTTKAFTATWEATLPKTPLVADLVYNMSGKDQVKISGKLENNLAVELEDLCLFYRDYAYPLGQSLGSKKTLELKISENVKMPANEWSNRTSDSVDKGRVGYNPSQHVKRLLFFENIDITNAMRNHALRPLDMSWRLQQDKKLQDSSLREAVLYARVRQRSGSGEALATDATQPLPARIWLGQLPGRTDGGGNPVARPSIAGHLNQDTYIRVLLPVRPSGS